MLESASEENNIKHIAMKIGICSDHAGFDYKCKLIPYLQKLGYETVDFGTDSPESIDYPDVAHPLANAVEKGEVDCGIAMCGTGNGHHPEQASGNPRRTCLGNGNRPPREGSQQCQCARDAGKVHFLPYGSGDYQGVA